MSLDGLLAEHGASALAFALFGMFLAGFGKGVVGFAMPMISISLIGSVLPAPLAIASIIAPTVFTNIWQMLRQGFGAARATWHEFARLNVMLFVMIALCAQLVALMSDRLLYLILGGAVSAFAMMQLAGFRLPPTPPDRRGPVEAVVAVVAGFFGGLSGVWGPPIVLYLTSLGIDKQAMVRAQGISFLIGGLVLAGAHLNTGLLLGEGGTLSLAMVVPAFAGMSLGLAVQDRLDAERFRRATLIVLVLAGLNLLRRGLAS